MLALTSHRFVLAETCLYWQSELPYFTEALYTCIQRTYAYITYEKLVRYVVGLLTDPIYMLCKFIISHAAGFYGTKCAVSKPFESHHVQQCPPIRNGVTSGQAFSLRADLTGETRHRPVRGLGSEKLKPYKLQGNFLKIFPGISYGLWYYNIYQISAFSYNYY